MRRGEIWWAELRKPEGSEPGYPRPVLVVQSNRFNDSAIQTVTILPITSSLKLSDAPGNVEVGTYGTGLRGKSVVNVSQALTVNKVRLTRRLGNASAQVVKQVEDGLRLVLDL